LHLKFIGEFFKQNKTFKHFDYTVGLLTSTVPGAGSTLNPGYSIILLMSYVSRTNNHPS